VLLCENLNRISNSVYEGLVYPDEAGSVSSTGSAVVPWTENARLLSNGQDTSAELQSVPCQARQPRSSHRLSRPGTALTALALHPMQVADNLL
jgi:hypothetical protein